MKHRCRFILITCFLPLTAQAAIMSDKMSAVCKAGDKACLSYTFGGADRFWLGRGQHAKCDVAADKKTVEKVKKNAQSKTSFYATGDVQPSAVLLLNYLNKNKLQSCSLTTSLAELAAKCASTQAADQTLCHAYVAGVMDIAVLMDELHQAAAKAPVLVPPFCENGAPKKNMSDPEVMQALTEYSQAHTANAGRIPAAAAIMDALFKKYPCAKTSVPAAANAPSSSTSGGD